MVQFIDESPLEPVSFIDASPPLALHQTPSTWVGTSPYAHRKRSQWYSSKDDGTTLRRNKINTQFDNDSVSL